MTFQNDLLNLQSVVDNDHEYIGDISILLQQKISKPTNLHSLL